MASTRTTNTILQKLAGLVLPALVAALLVLMLWQPVRWWLRGAEIFDEEAMREWIREARVESANLAELVRGYVDMADREARLKSEAARDDNLLNNLGALRQRIEIKREEIQEFLKALGNPPTRMYRGQLPLFPLVYRIAVQFADKRGLEPLVWDSDLPREASQYRELREDAIHVDVRVLVQYTLHAYHQTETLERQEATRRLLLGGLGMLLVTVGSLWYLRHQRGQRRGEHRRLLAEKQANDAERGRLEEELRRREAERKHEEAERQNLELKSQLFANIGIMAGSYAHNIKNLLVRPNDLLRRCLEEPASNQKEMVREVQETLATVTERLQQILQTVRRDPSRAEKVRIDLNAMIGDMHRTWTDLAREKWKMTLALEIDPAPISIEGDLSHLQQAIENLLFNARDATFEMRNHLREQARAETLSDAEKRQALLAATSWKGEVSLRTRREPGQVVVEVTDNGIGMTDEVRTKCAQTHFSTKRNNALFAGLSAGMGLGLSFVTVILAHHGATLEIESRPLLGATFRVRFPSS